MNEFGRALIVLDSFVLCLHLTLCSIAFTTELDSAYVRWLSICACLYVLLNFHTVFLDD
jgi:hypothetical protein